MSHKARFGIVGKLYAIKAFLIAALIGTAALVTAQFNDAIELDGKTEKVRVPQLQRIAAVELNVTRASMHLRHAILAGTPEEMQAAVKEIEEKRAALTCLVAGHSKDLDGPDSAARIADIQRLSTALWKVGEANLRLTQEGRKDDAFAYLVHHTVAARKAQGHGVSQIGQAVAHIEQADQQNAALTEESAAAAANVDRKVQELVECGALFKTKKSEGTAPDFRPAVFSIQTRHQRQFRLTPATA